MENTIGWARRYSTPSGFTWYTISNFLGTDCIEARVLQIDTASLSIYSRTRKAMVVRDSACKGAKILSSGSQLRLPYSAPGPGQSIPFALSTIYNLHQVKVDLSVLLCCKEKAQKQSTDWREATKHDLKVSEWRLVSKLDIQGSLHTPRKASIHILIPLIHGPIASNSLGTFRVTCGQHS